MDTLSTSIWQEFFGVSSETAFQTIIPALIAIFIFVFGLVVKWLDSWNKNRKENNQKREFIFSQVEVLLTTISEQRRSIEEFIESLKVDRNVNLEFYIKVTFNPKHINQIGSNELFKILVLDFFTKKENRLEKYNSFRKQLDLIDALRYEFKSSFEYSQTHFSRYEDKWNENIEIIGDLHDSWKSGLVSKGINPKDDQFLYSFNDIYRQWASIKNYTDMYVAEANLIDIVLQNARSFLPNQFAQIILRPLLRCKDAINNHRNLRKIKVKEFGKYLTQLDEIEVELQGFLELYCYTLNTQTRDTNSNVNEYEN